MSGDNQVTAAVEIAASAGEIYRALTDAGALGRWWTDDVSLEDAVGGRIKLGFYGRSIVLEGEIAALEPGRKVVWQFTGGHEAYIGTQMTFGVEETDAACRLRITQRGAGRTWQEPEKAHMAESWSRVLQSLKSYVETGKGEPISVG